MAAECDVYCGALHSDRGSSVTKTSLSFSKDLRVPADPALGAWMNRSWTKTEECVPRTVGLTHIRPARPSWKVWTDVWIQCNSLEAHVSLFIVNNSTASNIKLQVNLTTAISHNTSPGRCEVEVFVVVAGRGLKILHYTGSGRACCSTPD